MDIKEISPRAIRRLLVANRGEIATRILSSARELGIETYALYSENDNTHTYNAAHAMQLSSPAAYMNIEEMIKIVRENSIDALHPAYGFLSESPALAEKMAEIGVLVIGPGAQNLERTGDKLRARRLAEECGVPVLPAFTEPTGSVEAVRRFAQENGLPVMVKAVDGGGGRGIRLIRNLEGLGSAVKRAIEESPTRKVFAERAAVDGFRHVEVQIVGDGKGGVRHLWERECSIQRRYQKVVELAPSTVGNRSVVAPVIEAAVRIAKKVKYASLGTFEFLLNPHTKEFFFLEINPRIQVEHTITESICCIDIVKTQLRLAQGASFESTGMSSTSQDPLKPPQQHSIQLRLTAEDPSKNYSLCIGKIQSFNFPSGIGIRVDTALVPGTPAVITSDFDSVIAKIIITAQTWPDAVRKAVRTLEDTRVSGIQTNLAMLRAIVSHPDFEAGNCDTQWLESTHEDLLARSRKLHDQLDPFHGLSSKQSSNSSGAASAIGGGGGSTQFRKDDAWTINLRPLPKQKEEQQQQRHHLHLTKILRNDFPETLAAEILYTIPGSEPAPYTMELRTTSASGSAMSSQHLRVEKSDPNHVPIPLSGKLVEVLVDSGDVIEKDQPICVIKQMKMEVEVRSHRAGVVTFVTEAEDGEDVAEGMLAAVVEDERVGAKL